jgi:hypothetical protein
MPERIMMRVQHPHGDVRVLYDEGQYEVWNTINDLEYFVVRTTNYPKAKDAAILAADNERSGFNG